MGKALSQSAAADKLNQIADAIESGDTSALENSNDDYFKNLGKKLMTRRARPLQRGPARAPAPPPEGFRAMSEAMACPASRVSDQWRISKS